MTTKAYKKQQYVFESTIKPSDFVLAHWSYKDYLENEKNYSAQAQVTMVEKDHVLARLMTPIEEQHHITIYPPGWLICLPKTNNPTWNLYNRFEKAHE